MKLRRSYAGACGGGNGMGSFEYWTILSSFT